MVNKRSVSSFSLEVVIDDFVEVDVLPLPIDVGVLAKGSNAPETDFGQGSVGAMVLHQDRTRQLTEFQVFEGFLNNGVTNGGAITDPLIIAIHNQLNVSRIQCFLQ